MGHGPIKEDPAVERFNTFRETTYMRFRWTPAAARAAFIGFIGVPLAVYYFADKYHLRWDWVGKRRGQLLESTTAQTE